MSETTTTSTPSTSTLSENTSKPLLDGDQLRDWSATDTFAVTRESLARYAGVTRDPDPRRQAGDTAGPAYAFVPFTALLFSAVDELVGESGSSDEPPQIVHTHQDFRIHAPIRAGDELTVRARVTSLEPGPFGAVLRIVSTAARADGTPVNEQHGTVLVVGADCVNPIPPDAGPDEPAEPAQHPEAKGARTALVGIDPDHPARYAEASGDTNPIHVDAAFARAAGFPGPIAHGMLTLALVANSLAAGHPDLAVAHRLAVEFTRPVFPGDRLTVRWTESASEGPLDLVFEVLNRRRRTVLRGGLLTLAKD